MTALTKETLSLMDALPADKAQALLEYARYLIEKADEEAWDRKFADPKYRPKLQAMMEEAEREIAAGKTEPLDPRRM